MEKSQLAMGIEVPEGVEFQIEKGILRAKGPKGEASKKIGDSIIKVSKEGSSVKLEYRTSSRKAKARFYSAAAHIRNMIKGVTEGHEYRLQICSSHFPMNVTASNTEIIVKNFLGEKVPRKLRLSLEAEVKVDGTAITVKSASKEAAGQTAAQIEQLCRITNRDRRIFQDGIYITYKDGKEIK